MRKVQGEKEDLAVGGGGVDGFRSGGKWTVRMDDTLKAKNDCGKRRSVSVQNESGRERYGKIFQL